MTQLRLGDIRIDKVVESCGPIFEPNFLFPDATAEAIAEHKDWLQPHFQDPASGKLIMSFHSYVVRTGRHTIVVDGCIGNDKERPSRDFWHRLQTPYLDHYAGLGVDPAEVDFVMCTHLHVDHVGWNTKLVNGRWVPTFPNAKYVFARTEYEHWQRIQAMNPNEPVNHGSFADSVLPVVEAGQAVFVDMDHAFDDAMWLKPAPGHTPGNVTFNLRSGDARAVLCGDTVHHPVQFAHPEWSSQFCDDADLSRKSRRGLLEALADSDTVLLPAHFPDPSGGRVVRAGDQFRFSPIDVA
jgi:glyoxylase-like metal-dependent hydrolase (beta-lactamase superfamily II)